ncbi:MAG: histidinol dehydrogenase, partial [Nitrososphaerales archaeon]
GKVQLIAGPGNDYVTSAKKQLSASGEVLIDSLAGHTELLIVADDSANPKFIAEDLLSQAEHGNRTLCGVVSNSIPLIEFVKRVLMESLPRPRQEHILRSILFTVLTESLEQMVEFSESLAPEHLELMVAKPDRLIRRLRSAGLLLLGGYTPCSSTDYIVGTNHILPTGGTAVSFPGLGVERFLKRVTVVRGTKESLLKSSRYISALTKLEGFPNHAMAVEARFNKEGKRK